ncbi:MAG: heme-binding protein [Gammaproteobacteria bacterium]
MKHVAILCAVLVRFLAVCPIAMAIEEPAFDVVAQNDTYEIRRYAPYIVAETDVTGDLGEAGGKAFRILAGYIFGKNQNGTKMNMTAPVESRPLSDTTPMSTASTNSEGIYTFGFVMETGYTMDTLPVPNDARITLRAVPGRLVAAHRFSGRWTDGNYQKHETLLIEALARDDVDAIGKPVLARYNGPMTPWFLRRNEVLVDVAPN